MEITRKFDDGLLCRGVVFGSTNGTYTWVDGSKYVGEWKNQKPHGQGTFKCTIQYNNRSSTIQYTGEWEKGKPKKVDKPKHVS